MCTWSIRRIRDSLDICTVYTGYEITECERCRICYMPILYINYYHTDGSRGGTVYRRLSVCLSVVMCSSMED